MDKFLRSILTWLKKNKYLTFLILFYFVFRLINLTKLPIFNDEAIYLDWGFRETHREGFLYYSLYDGKQPLLMWIFGIMESVFSNPLFAGRIVSVIAGFLTMLGIFKLAKTFFTEKIALVSILLYIIIPIFSFYDRQALMESSVAAVGIWAGYFLLKGFKENFFKNSILAGLILGIGFFIKSSSLIFSIVYVVLTLVFFSISKKVKIIENLFIAIGVFILSISLLIINPQFWSTLTLNSRYSLTFNEILTFPFSHWLQSILANTEIGFFYLTPLLFLVSVFGIVQIILKKNNFQILFLSFFLLVFSIATLAVRAPGDRYIVSFLPFLVIPVAYVFSLVFNKNKLTGVVFAVVVLIVPFGLTVLQIADPPSYLSLTLKYTRYNNATYLQGVTSGYAVSETINYFNNLSKSEKLIIAVGENTGNPESAIFTYFSNRGNIKAIYLDSRLFKGDLSKLDCLYSPIPVYFVARDEQLVGLDKFMQKIKTIRNPYGSNTIGIYVFKKNCRGETLKLELPEF